MPSNYPISTRLRQTDIRMKEYGTALDGEPLVITEGEVTPFIKELADLGVIVLHNLPECNYQIMSGGNKLTYAGRTVKVI